MSDRSWAFSDDLSRLWVGLTLAAACLFVVLLLVELRRRERLGGAILLSGVLGAALFAAAVLRPVRVSSRGSLVGPRVVVLVDQSRRLSLPAKDGTRREVAQRAVAELGKNFKDARLALLGFGDGAPQPIDADKPAPPSKDSDLSAAIEALAASAGERPQAVVVVSDGRLTRPTEGADRDALKRSVGALGVPVHTVSVVEDAPRDASIRSVRAAGAAVAHQPLALTIEIGCSGGLACDRVPVTVRELRHGVDPAVLASGVAEVTEGRATVELSITLDRAGARVVEVSIDAPDADTIAENNTRTLAFSVTRERLRLLHVAGRPTYDVRALRMWLKSDESVDLVAFFILRTNRNDPQADESELALIPFPVDELFTEHLPSFDAVILQDIDAVEYKLSRHLSSLAAYVESGGGLIMVGGQFSFAGGRYAGTALDRVLPVELRETEKFFDTEAFTPGYTDAGREAPVLGGLRDLFGDELPEMPGSNTLGKPRPGSIVLWQHEKRRAGDAPMPVLALGESGDGRSIALGIDGTHGLAFGELAARAAGRAYGALWDGLLGWLMRDPRYEAVRVELLGECIASEPTRIRVTPLPGSAADVSLSLERLGNNKGKPLEKTLKRPPSGALEFDVGKLEAGGYSARVSVGSAPPTRYDFACERGGEAWSDSRPDPERLQQIADATGGKAVLASDVSSLPLPASTRIAAERHVTPLMPPWAWTLCAALALGGHWLARRRGGLA